MRKNLVILRAGSNSLHNGWLTSAYYRNWDLVIIPYQKLKNDNQTDVHYTNIIEGHKWIGIQKFLSDKTYEDKVKKYEYVWLPDDDIITDQLTINKIFELAKSNKARLCQPSLSENSYYSHKITMTNMNFTLRCTNFVELMCPCLDRLSIEFCKQTLRLSPSGYGWGIDYLWAKLLNYEDIYIFDNTSVQHSRPISGAPEFVISELKNILRTFDLTEDKIIFSGIQKSGEFILNSRLDFSNIVESGYKYLHK